MAFACLLSVGLPALMAALLAKAVGSSPQTVERFCQLQEERETGYFVANLKELLRRDLHPEELANVSVRPYLPDDPVAPLFRLAEDGTLTTAGRIDRDSLCDSRGLCCEKDMRQMDQLAVCDLRYDAAATTVINRRFLALTLNIQLVDLNDNKPVFQRSRSEVRFKETDRAGVSVALPTAHDADWGRNGVVAYRLGSGAEQFELRQVRDDRGGLAFPDAVRALELVNREPLDRESRASYGFQLLAEDGDRNVGVTFINVSIDDVNDCSPEFLNGSRLTVSLDEDARPHSVVFSVLAVDRDIGQNGRVGYTLRSGQRRPYPVGLFGIDQYSGRVTLNGRLLYRRGEENTYELLVTAFDYGSPRRSSEMEVEVRVIDVNNHSPIVRVIGFGSQTSSVRVLENVAYTARVIATVLVSDQDSGDNGRVECRLVNEPQQRQQQQQQQASFGLQYMKQMGSSRAASYHLYAVRTFDRETQAVHIVRLECSDHGSPPRRTEAIVRVEVEDANDSPPVWRRTEFAFSVQENQPEGTTIGSLQAEDADAPPNDAIQYRIEPPTFTDVRIYPSTGRLVTNRVFDREEGEGYTFQVVAYNTVEPHYSATASVVLTILDVNDNNPVFDLATPRRIQVQEDAPRGTLVIALNVTDADEPVRREFNFILTSDDSTSVGGQRNRIGGGASKFQIDSLGRLTLRDVLDRELEKEYHLRIGVSDGVHPARSSVFYLTVEVGDVNDTPPRFIFPDPERRVNRVNVSSALAPRSLVARIAARDDDADENGNVTYRLLPTSAATGGSSAPDDSEHFELEPLTGNLLVRANLRPFAGRLFVLRIEASDAGRDRQLKRDTLLQVAVENDSSSSSSTTSAAARPHPPSQPGGGHRDIGRGSSEVSGPALLLVSGLAILVLLILILSIAFLIVKRRAETASQSGVFADPAELTKMDPRAYESLTLKTQPITGRLEPAGYPAQSIPLAMTKNRRQHQRRAQTLQQQQYEKCDGDVAPTQHMMAMSSGADLAKLGVGGLDAIPAHIRSTHCQSDTDLRQCGAPDVAFAASTMSRQLQRQAGGCTYVSVPRQLTGPGSPQLQRRHQPMMQPQPAGYTQLNARTILPKQHADAAAAAAGNRKQARIPYDHVSDV